MNAEKDKLNSICPQKFVERVLPCYNSHLSSHRKSEVSRTYILEKDHKEHTNCFETNERKKYRKNRLKLDERMQTFPTLYTTLNKSKQSNKFFVFIIQVLNHICCAFV